MGVSPPPSNRLLLYDCVRHHSLVSRRRSRHHHGRWSADVDQERPLGTDDRVGGEGEEEGLPFGAPQRIHRVGHGDGYRVGEKLIIISIKKIHLLFKAKRGLPQRTDHPPRRPGNHPFDDVHDDAPLRIPWGFVHADVFPQRSSPLARHVVAISLGERVVGSCHAVCVLVPPAPPHELQGWAASFPLVHRPQRRWAYCVLLVVEVVLVVSLPQRVVSL